jgi:hypothetical protein
MCCNLKLSVEIVRDLVGIVWDRFGAGLGPYMGKPSLTVPVFAFVVVVAVVRKDICVCQSYDEQLVFCF